MLPLNVHQGVCLALFFQLQLCHLLELFNKDNRHLSQWGHFEVINYLDDTLYIIRNENEMEIIEKELKIFEQAYNIINNSN